MLYIHCLCKRTDGNVWLVSIMKHQVYMGVKEALEKRSLNQVSKGELDVLLVFHFLVI